ncbi:MAG TPA: RNB domain-containing ribonuclease, partial [Candidatus Xenobia bacterium]
MLQPTPGAARPPLPPRLGFDVHVLPDPHHTDTVGLHLVGDTAYSLAGFRGQMTAAEVAQTQAADPAKVIGEPDIRDMRDKPWSAIDNKSSKDPDQVSFAERLPDGSTRVYVAAADVDGLVSQNSPLDQRAMDNMTTIYTDLQDYTMLPTDFCQDKTVLLQGKDRAALVTEFVVTPQGDVKDAKIYRADVNNHCQLNYDEVDQWFGDHQQVPPTMAGQAAMAEQLNLQDEASQWIEHGEVQKGRPPAHAPKGAEHSGEAMRLVEMQMRTVNRVTANYLLTHGFPAIVKTRDVTPQNWAKIRALAPNLPEVPDNVALQGFMDDQKKLGADHFQQLQKQVSTLLGRPRDTVAVPGHEHELFNMG